MTDPDVIDITEEEARDEQVTENAEEVAEGE